MKIFLMCLIFSALCSTCHADETQTIAEVIGAEGCSQGFIGLQAISNTIQNRAKRQHKTPYEIVTAKNQYFGYTNPKRHKIYMTCKADADYLAKNIMNLEDLTDGAEYFLLPGEPVRKWHGRKTVTIKAHTFYRNK